MNSARRIIWALIALQIMVGLANGSTIAIGSLIAADLGGEVAGTFGGILAGPVVTAWGMPTLAVICLVIVIGVASYQLKARNFPVHA